MANILPEVRPEVISMPDNGFVMQTGGSARKRTIKFRAADSSFPISGVPGHTHNSSAVVSIEADYSVRRTQQIEVTGSFGEVQNNHALRLTAPAYTDSPAMPDEEERFRRAIERGVGQMTLLPENCQHIVQEPTKSISEIRTIVTGKNMLDTLTYVQELNGWVDPVSGKRTEDFSFNDIRVPVFGYVDPFKNTDYSYPAGNNISNRTTTAPAQIFHTASTVVFNIVRDSDNDDRLGLTADGEQWDGTLVMQWDDDKRLYRSRQTVITDIRVFEVKDANTDAIDRSIDIVFPPFETSIAQDGFCVLSNSGVTQTLATATETNGNVFAPRLRVDIIAGNTKLEDLTYWYGMPAYRIRVGSDIAMPGPPRTVANARSYDEGASLWQRFRNIQVVNLIQETMYQSANGPNSTDDVVGLGAVYDAVFAKNSIRFPNIGHHEHFSGIFNSAGQNTNADTFTRYGPVTRYDYSKVHGMPMGWYDINRTICGQVGGTPNTNPFAHANVSGGTENPDLGPDSGLCDLFEIGLRIGAEIKQPSADFMTGPANGPIGNFYKMSDVVSAQQTGSGYVPIQQQSIEMYRSAFGERFYNIVNGVLDLNSPKFAGATIDYNVTGAAQTGLIDKINPDGNTEIHNHPNYRNMSGHYDFPGVFISCPYELLIIPYANEGSADINLTISLGHNVTAQVTTEPFMCIMDMDMVGFREKGTNKDRIRIECNNELRNIHSMGNHVATLDAGQQTFTITDDSATNKRWFTTVVSSNTSSTRSIVTIIDDENLVDIPNGQTAVEQATVIYNAATALIHNAYSAYARQGNCFQIPATSDALGQHVVKVQAGDNAEAIVLLPNMVLPYRNERRVYLLTLQDTAGQANRHHQRVFYFTQDDISERIIERAGKYSVYTRIARLRRLADVGGDFRTRDPATAEGEESAAQMDTLISQNPHIYVTVLPDTLSYLFFNKPTGEYDSDNDIFGFYKAESLKTGVVYRSKKRISQHVCAPVLNPNKRIGCIAPLNYESRHLPPEMRDFRLRFDNVNFDFLSSSKVDIKDLVLYQFNGGNQVQTAETSLMYLPQFREYKGKASAGVFDIECRTNYGLPSFFCIFCRDADEFARQPLIGSLSMSSLTTMKKSNVIYETDAHELYHLTQRNVHPMAEYDHKAFNKRQVILLATEDIGTLGLATDNYQQSKRASFRVAGTVDRPGTVTIIFIYNNRGLAIEGRQLSVVRF